MGTAKAMLRQVQGELSVQGWQQVRDGIEVKVIAHERLGKLQEQNWRAAACFEVKITKAEGRLQISWAKDEQKKRELCGCYLLRTNVAEKDPLKLWKQYIQLVDVEWAFRISKDELELRPVWHQQAERVKAHIQVCFIAYAM